ncbi:hypothetical protein niasHT_034952 [Heterodera trifolii]|uniref:Integrase catalytic domain-containing protein n=1 Tax=Heterodera trifolii TaxID=157864 RepID=A0ABD2IEB6_9BILA
MTTRQRKRLLPYASFVRTLARRRTEKGARKLLVQTGSGLGGVFAALLTPILIDLARTAINSGLKGDESDEEQVFDLGADGVQRPASQSRRRLRRPRHYNDDEEMPLMPPSPPLQAENRGQKRKANEFYSSWEEGAKRQLRHEDAPVPSSSKIANRQRRRKLPPVSWRREEQQIPADIQQEEPFQPAPQPSIPIHPQLNRKRKAQHDLNDIRESKKSLIGLEELRPPPLQQEASLRFKQKRTNKSRVTLPQHSNSLALAKLHNPPRDLLAEAASAPLPDDDADDFELSQNPGVAAQAQPIPPGPLLPSKAKKRKSNKAEEENERKRVKIGSRKRNLLAEAASAPFPDDFELAQQPGTSAQIESIPPGPPLPSRTKKRKDNKAEEYTEKKKSRIGSRKRLSSPNVIKKEPKKQKNSGSDALSEEQRRQFVEDQHLFTIPNSQLTNEQKRRRLEYVFNRNPTKYGVHGDTILNNARNPITDSSVAQALDYIIQRRAGRIPQFRQPPGTKLIRDRINRDIILQSWTAPPLPPRGPKRKLPQTEQMPELKQKSQKLRGMRQARGREQEGLTIPFPTRGAKRKSTALSAVETEIPTKNQRLRPQKRINFPRARTTAAGFMTDCQVDLADFQALSRHNSGNRYLMVVIDVLSKRIFVTPLRTKKSEDMVEGFKRVFSTMPMKPHRIFSDKGTEFRNQQLKKLFDEEEVEKYESTHSEKKAALAERAIRQIKKPGVSLLCPNKNPQLGGPIRRKRSAIDPTSPPSARIVPKSPPNVTKKVIVPTSPPRVGQKNEENSEESLTNVTMPPEKQQKIEKQPEVVRLKSTIDPTPSVSNPPPPVPVSNPVDQNKNVSINQSVSQKINIPPPSVSSSSINVTKKQEELQNSNGPTVSNPPPQLPVTNQTTVSPVNQITPAKTNYTKPSSSLINEEKLKEIGPPPKQRTEKSTVETVSPTLPPAVPTHSNVTVKKATSPPRVIATDIIGPPPKQRNEKSINTKHVQAQLVNEIIPETTKKTTITTTTTTTITEPPKDTIDDFIEQIEEPSERNNAERLLSVLFGNEEWKKINLRIVRQIIEGVDLQYNANFERFKAVFTHPKIEFISFSPQLGYVLGFENSQHVRNNEIAKYGSDLRGGFASFAVYAKGLTENMIVGNSLSSLLRVVSVSGAEPGAYTEKIYDSPLYARVLPKEVSEIEIELRTMTDGRLVPFSYGTVLVVLIFKKVINF